MGRMKDLVMDIESDIIDGELTFEQIAVKYGITFKEVSEIADNMENTYEYDTMDGDHASALASAGWGTDEDYSSAEY